MRRYMLFAGNYGSENGGMHDFKAAYNTPEEAMEATRDIFRNGLWEWVHVYDTESFKMLKFKLW